MTPVKRLFWLPITLALAAIAPLGPACGLPPSATGAPTVAAPVQPGANIGHSTTSVLSTSTLPSTEATETSDVDWGAPFGFLDAPPLPDNYAELGNEWIVPGFGWARWENIETTAGVYNWSAIDLTNMQQMDALGIRLIPELRSVNPLYGTSWDVDEYPDGNVAAWEDFVTALVEKFDGDGVNDLDGAPTIRAYSFLHELAPLDYNYWTAHPDEYAEMFDATYRAMKAACPDCVLFLPGGNLEHFQFQDEGAFVDGWIVKVLGYLEGFTTQFDDMGFDYHFWAGATSYDDPYSDGTDYRFHQTLIETIRHCYERFGYTDMPIICRESGMTGIGDDGSYTPNEPLQAAYVVKMYTLIASLGQKVCAWTTTLEYAHGPTPGHLFRHMGLIHNPANPDGLSHRKLAWYTYKKMIETLDGADWDNVETVVDGVDNVYVYRFDVNGAPVTVAWWDYFDETGYTPADTKPITLTGLSSTAITVTNAVPAAESGRDVTDYATAFTVTTYTVSDGTVTIPLGEEPVLVEEGDSATMDSFFGINSTHDHDGYPYFKNQTGMSEQDFYNWADAHQAILKFHWSRTGLQYIWERIEPVLGAGYDWDNAMDTDDITKAVYAQGQLNLIAVVSPDRTNASEDWRLYEADFKSFCQDLVERYDGDGIDDADANVSVKMWQAYNEDGNWVLGKGWSREDYVMFVTWMEEAVHAADPDAKIMLVSFEGSNISFFPDWIKDTIDDLIAAGVPFDAIDMHSKSPYNNIGGVPGFPMPELVAARSFLDSRGLYDVEIFSCENATWSGCPTGKVEQTEQEQARFLAQRVAYGPYVSLDHYLWENLCDWYRFGGDDGSIWNTMGLVGDGATAGTCEDPARLNTERVAYWTYKLLAEAIDKPANSFVGQMILTVDNDRYGYEYEETATAIHKYVLWSWVGDQDVTFPVTEENYRVTNLITDRYGNILEQYDLAASGGQLTVTIGADPLLIQPVGDAPVSHPIYLPLVLR